VIKSFLGLTKRVLNSTIFVDYLIDDAYKYLLLRSPMHSDLVFWRNYIKSTNYTDFINEIQRSQEKLNLNAKIESHKLLFMHIPKTAGTSFRLFLNRFTEKIFIVRGEGEYLAPNDTCLFTGHFGFAHSKHYTHSHSFTILRDPIERIVSLYRYGSSEASRWSLSDQVRTLNFYQWISSDNPEVIRQIDSCYVRTITDDLPEPFESRVTDSFNLALKRYSEFSAVGDQSNLKPFCQKVASLLDVPIFIMPLRNHSEHHFLTIGKYPPRPKLTPEIQDRLGQLTRLDYEVYNRFRAK
jgi:hypothetical protein